MSYSCKILLDSISETGKRITTFEITFPRIILAEFNTHRMFSRNSASSRAIPFNKQFERVISDPFIPEKFPIDGKGMQPDAYIDNKHRFYPTLVREWLDCRDSAVASAKDLYDGIFGDANNPSHIHKQLVNRLLEPFQYHTVIVTATEFDNFFKLRCNENAQYEIRRIADLMYEAYHYYDDKDEDDFSWGAGLDPDLPPPQNLKVGEWHTPLVYTEDDALIIKYIVENEFTNAKSDTELIKEIKKKISVARCARVSYLTHDGKRDISKDLELFERLRTSGHWSPFEHVATPHFNEPNDEKQWKDWLAHNYCDTNGNIYSGNFTGWFQYRKEFVDENCVNFRKDN